MQNLTLTFDISTLLDEHTGAREIYSFEGPVIFEDIDAKSDIKGKAEIMRIEDGVNAKVDDVEIKVELQCKKCLKKFAEKITIDTSERQFYINLPKKVDDPNDLFLINMKKLTIDLTEPLRQEIILHLPLIPVCSSGCKGICPVCGKNRNKKDCDCKKEEIPVNKPLSALKNICRGQNRI